MQEYCLPPISARSLLLYHLGCSLFIQLYFFNWLIFQKGQQCFNLLSSLNEYVSRRKHPKERKKTSPKLLLPGTRALPAALFAHTLHWLSFSPLLHFAFFLILVYLLIQFWYLLVAFQLKQSEQRTGTSSSRPMIKHGTHVEALTKKKKRNLQRRIGKYNDRQI